MKVYLLDTHPYFLQLGYKDYEEYKEHKILFKGNSLKEAWNIYEMIVEKEGEHSDFPYANLGTVMASERVRNLLIEKLQNNIEFLQVTTPIGSHYFINVINKLDCIDHDNSLAKRYSDGMLDEYTNLSLLEDKLQDQYIFKIYVPEINDVLFKTYVTDKFKSILEGNNLTGYQLIEVWDSEISWQEKERKYNDLINSITESLTRKFDFGEACRLVKEENATVFSEKWSMKLTTEGELSLGRLLEDGTYSWILPAYYPPVILYQDWGVK
ncbi:hypothetical protein GK047_01210 [Paenibacillus sp. SYP-B3998]|uniref:Immunity MXAN-0049 protein domain-containing protein n=1 Tax=Paenibacillus sp. SYP-B3998 TaxID=2678564 RepID=A0A6G3ZR10_9BACL|nr:DUF1629 domain-containing protein [Paenibacillus sp. SYP-B3998]NEW04643.1 hypothetical protein [Paenibacillus sp. SYP-B3998]